MDNTTNTQIETRMVGDTLIIHMRLTASTNALFRVEPTLRGRWDVSGQLAMNGCPGRATGRSFSTIEKAEAFLNATARELQTRFQGAVSA